MITAIIYTIISILGAGCITMICIAVNYLSALTPVFITIALGLIWLLGVTTSLSAQWVKEEIKERKIEKKLRKEFENEGL